MRTRPRYAWENFIVVTIAVAVAFLIVILKAI
jgi:hypothetical protein